MISFSPLSDWSEYSFGISEPNIPRISGTFKWYQHFNHVGPGVNHAMFSVVSKFFVVVFATCCGIPVNRGVFKMTADKSNVNWLNVSRFHPWAQVSSNECPCCLICYICNTATATAYQNEWRNWDCHASTSVHCSCGCSGNLKPHNQHLHRAAVCIYLNILLFVILLICRLSVFLLTESNESKLRKQ